MATHSELRNYLAYWLQLGKPLILNGQAHLPQPPLNLDRPTPEFEALWDNILKMPHLAYLEGSELTIAQLLDGTWDITPCARCSMPVPLPNHGLITNHCICQDMENWPNNNTLQPHTPINTQEHLIKLRHRLTPSS